MLVLDSATRAKLSDAEIVWTPFLRTLASKPAWREDDWNELRRLRRVAVDGPGGAYEILDLPGEVNALGSVLWITHPRFLAHSQLLRFPDAPIDLPAEIVLDPHDRFEARVVDATGKRIEKALIRQGFDLEQVVLNVANHDQLARRVFQRSAVTSAEGQVVLHPLPGRNLVEAALGDLRSMPWSGEPRGTVELVLAPTFQVHGRVNLQGDTTSKEGLIVRAYLREFEDYRPLGRAAVREDATYGPLVLPIVASDSHVLVLEGGRFAQERKEIVEPDAGSLVRVDFAPKSGVELSIHVYAEESGDIEGALVSIHWNESGTWQKIERKTDPDGLVRFSECRPGKIWVRARARGFSPQLLPEVEYLESPSAPVQVLLGRAGRIDGVCIAGGQPVEDFAVTFWQGQPSNKVKIEVENSHDGRFTIEEAPVGEVLLFATSPLSLRSEATRIDAGAENTAEVVLEMLPQATARGRVVDARSGAPIVGARVQSHVVVQNRKLALIGPAAVTDLAGVFFIEALVPGSNLLEISAAGYANKAIHPEGKPDESIDLGVIPLVHQRNIEIVLEGEEGIDCSGFYCQLSGIRPVGERSFTSDCSVRFEGLDPGEYVARIGESNASTVFAFIELSPTRDRRIEIPWPRETFTVEIVPAAGSELPSLCWLRVSHLITAREDMTQYYSIRSDNRAEVRRFPGSVQVVLQLDDPQEQMLAVERFDLSRVGSGVLQFHVGERTATLRVVDSDRQPVADASVNVFLPNDPSGWQVTRHTDRDGRCELRGLAPESVVVSVHHPSVGLSPNEVIVFDRDRSAEIILDPKLSLRGVVFERGVTLAEIEVHATDGNGLEFGLGPASTSASGIVVWSSVEEGEYIFRVLQPGIWPYEQKVQLESTGGPFPIEVRRLGSLGLRAKNSYGSGFGGAEVDLYSMEKQAWVSEWISQGLVPAPPSGLRTDAEGRLFVHGLPNGEYRARVDPVNGERFESVVLVPPLSTGEATLYSP